MYCEVMSPLFFVNRLGGYALLSLPAPSEGGRRLTLRPNYSDAVAKVFTDCAASLLADEGFGVLSQVQGGTILADLLLWVPDWSVATRRAIFGEIRSVPSSFDCSMKKSLE